MEIYRTGCTDAYDGTDTSDMMTNYNGCGCDECTCYEDEKEDGVCGAIHDMCPDWGL